VKFTLIFYLVHLRITFT